MRRAAIAAAGNERLVKATVDDRGAGPGTAAWVFARGGHDNSVTHRVPHEPRRRMVSQIHWRHKGSFSAHGRAFSGGRSLLPCRRVRAGRGANAGSVRRPRSARPRIVFVARRARKEVIASFCREMSGIGHHALVGLVESVPSWVVTVFLSVIFCSPPVITV